MVRRFIVLLFAVVVPAVGPAARAEEQSAPAQAPQPAIRLGLLTGMFPDVSADLIHAAATPFKDVFKKETGFNGEVELMDDYETLAEKLDSKKVHFGVFHGFEYAWVKDRYPNLQPLVVADPKVGLVQACLVVNAQSTVKNPSDLPGNCVTIPIGTKAHCCLFLDRLQQGLPAGCCGPVAGTRTLGPEEALDGVGVGKLPAVLVDISSLKIYQANKPTAAAKLKVLAQSEHFPPGVLVYRKDGVDPTVVDKVRNGLTRVQENAQGRAFLLVWKLNGFIVPRPEYDALLQKSLKAYPPPGPAHTPPATGPGGPPG